MYPILFEIGPLTIRGYGVMLAISFLLGIYLALKRSDERGLNQNHMVNLCLIAIISSIIGARIMYVIPHWDEFSGHPLDAISPFQSSGAIGLLGLTMYGGFIGAIGSALIYLRWYKLPVWRACDAFAPSIALGIGITRIGCFLNGCCFGLPTESAIGIVFPAFSAAGSFYPDLPLHPAQLYNVVLGFGLFGLIVWLDKEDRFDGYIFSILLIIEPMTRFTVDFFRYYESSMTLTTIDGIGLSVNQGVSVLICGVGFFLLGRLRNQSIHRKNKKQGHRRKPSPSSAQKTT